MGVAFVRGLEGSGRLRRHSGRIQPEALHGLQSLTGRDRTPAWIPENYLREYFLPTFDAAVKAVRARS